MSIDVSSEARVRSEIWHSFDSLLRSYSAVAALDGSEPLKVKVIGDSITLEVRNARLDFSMDPVSGIGKWLYKDGGGPEYSHSIDLTLDGAMVLDGITKDLDHAAIDFVAMLRKDAENLTVKQP